MAIEDFSYSASLDAHRGMDTRQAYSVYMYDRGQMDYLAKGISNNIAHSFDNAANKISDSVGNAANQISSSVDNAANLVSSSVDNAANQISSSIKQAASAVCGKLDTIDTKLQFLNRRMDIVIEQNNMTNMLLVNIAELLKIPNSEKERQHEISLGIKFFANASKDPDLFEDSLEHFLKAEELLKQDYFVLHRIGCIYLYAEKFLNPEKAYDYFTRAAKYARSESDPNAVRLANLLTTQANKGYTAVFSNTDKIKMLAGDSYEKAAFSAYILGDLENAIQNQRSAYQFCSTGENQFLLAKYLAHNGDIDESVTNLESAIEKVPNVAAAVFQEKDMVERPEVIKSVVEMNAELTKKLSEMKEIAPSDSVRNYIQTALDSSYAEKVRAYRRLSRLMS